MRKFVRLTWLLVLSCSMLYAQDRTVTGRVTEQDTGEPIPGANIVLQGTTTGTVTDIDGQYSLSIPAQGGVLIVSFVGYVTHESEIGNRSVIDVALRADVTSLSEIVVTGYGTQERKEITSAVASVKAENFNVGNVQNPAQLIQGKVAGLTITRPGGNPNAGFNIRLRGLSTLGANTQPLVVVDGVLGATLENIDPNDIESIDVLKDGSAAAIYGSRGSSGVILITTKQGREGRITVDYNGFVSADNAFRFIDVMKADEWRTLKAEVNPSGTNDFGASTDWFDEMTRTGWGQTHNLAVGGGTRSTQYRVSLNYRGIEGTAINTGFQQINSRLNLTQKAINDRLTLNLIVGGTYRKSQFGNDAAFRYATIYNPTAPVRSDAEEFKQYGGYFQQVLFDFYNPVAILEQNLNDGWDKRLNVVGSAAYEIVDNLFADVFYSLQSESFERGSYFAKESFFVGRDRNGLARRSLADNFSQIFRTTLRWSGSVGNTNIEAVGGYEYQDFINQGFSAEGGNFITNQFSYNNLSAALDFRKGLGSVNSYKNKETLVAFLGRVNFNFEQTYFLSLSGRYEGSSTFGEDNKWGFFPGVSAGVELANFIGSPSINNLKLRGSYGVTGNRPPNPYLSLLRFGPGSAFFFQGDYVPSYGPVSNPNPNLRWENKAEFNIGFDFSLFGDKMFGAIDYYTRTTTDLLQEFAVPVPPNLFNRTWFNVGEIRNSGLELLLNYRAVDKPNFSYTPTLTFTYYLENKLVSLSDPANGLEYGVRDIANMGSPGQNNTPTFRVEEGQPIGQMWGLMYEGIAPNGDWIHRDINNDGQIDNTDRTYIGNGMPDVELGFANLFRMGRWDLNIMFRGMFGHDIINSNRAFYEVPNVITSYNVMRSSTDLRNPDTGTLLNQNSGLFSSLHVENGNFFKLDNMNIGYNFSLPQGSAFRNLRVYLGGNNLFVITSYNGSDPEFRPVDTEENLVLAPGIDRRNTWYMVRSFALGVNLGF